MTIKTSAALCGVNRGTHTQLTQLIAYHTIGGWGTGSDNAVLIQSTKAPGLIGSAGSVLTVVIAREVGLIGSIYRSIYRSDWVHLFDQYVQMPSTEPY